MSIEFILTSLVVVITPGTGALYTVAAGLSRGAKASIVASVGCTLGVVPHMLAAITGVAALLHASATAFEIVKYLGVAYLLYMAWSTLRDKGALTVDESAGAPSSLKVIVSAVALNVLNPKLTIFFLAFLPQFVSPADPNSLLRMTELSAVFMVLTFVVFAAYGVCAAAVRTHIISRPKVMDWLRRTFAAAFVALSASLAFAAR